VDLAVTVRAEEDTFGELSLDLVPTAWDAFGRDAELFRFRVEVMELERVDRLA